MILKLYGAREEDPSFSPCSIAEEVSDKRCVYLPENSDAVAYILNNLGEKDLVIVFSAGKGLEFSRELCAALHLEGSND